MATFSIKGKAAIVTGGGSGINLAFVQLLLAQQCNVVIADLSLREEAKAVVDSHQGSPRAVFQKTDVTDWTQLNELFARAVKEFGTVDIVCPGAGIFEEPFSNFWNPPGTAGSISRDPSSGLGHYATLDINLTHPIRVTQLAIAEFLKPSNGAAKASSQNPKRIVHISSIAGQTATINVPLYIASKHAISGFVRSFAPLEESHGIRINAVAPGVVKTPLWLDHPEKMLMLDEQNDIWVTAEEVAQAMVKLVEDPSMVGGTILEVGHEQTRVVPQFGNPGPSGSGHKTSNAVAVQRDTFAKLSQDGWGKLL